jgi:hypothetical protein
MPSKTPKQAKTMRAAAHNPQFAKKVGHASDSRSGLHSQ